MAASDSRPAREHDLHLLGAKALAVLLLGIGLLLMAGGGAQWLIRPLGGLGPWNVVLGLGFWLGAALAWQLQHRGRPRLACAVALVGTMFGLASQALLTGLGVHSLALAGGALLVVLGGALLGTVWAVALALLDAALALALFSAEQAGRLPGLAAAAGLGAPQRVVSQLMLAGIALAVGLLVVRTLRLHLERALAQEQQLAELLRIGTDWTWEADRRGRLTQLSPSFEASTGQRIADFLRIGQPGGPVVVADAAYRVLQCRLRAGEPFRNHLAGFQCADGAPLFVRVDGDPVFDRRGNLLRWRGVSRNVTPEQLALKAQRRSEALLDRLVRISPDAINVARVADGRILLANAAFMAQSGLSEAEVIGRSALELGLWRSPEEPRRLREALHADGAVRNLRSVVYPRHKGPRDVLLTAAAFDWDDDPVAVITIRDITDSERARIEGDAILDNATLGIALVRRQRFERVNRCFEGLFGRPAGSLDGQPVATVWPEAVLPEARPDGGVHEVVHEFARPEPAAPRVLQLRVVRASAAAPRDAAEADDVASVWMLEDITDRRRTERDLAAAKQQAEAANDAKSRFLATMSHEIRTPLNGVLGLARLLHDSGLDAQRRAEYLGHLVGAAEQLTGIVSNVLDLSKIESGHVQIDHIGFDLRGVVASTFHTFAPLGGERGLAMRCRVDDALPARVVGDPARLRQILSNYLANALKFTRLGEVALLVGPGRDGRVRLAVHDTGIGVPPEVRGRLFRPFAQADSSTTRRYGGTGLGLSICLELAQRMGGTVGVDSDGSSGSRFWAELPLPAEADAHGRPPGPTELPPTLPLDGLCVLLAEDNPVNLLVAGAMLARLGAQVIEAHDGDDAVALACQHAGSLHAVLMDLHMPGTDGLAAARQLRADPRTTTLPVYAFSAAVLEQERRDAHAAGMDGFVAKPIDAGELLRVLQPLRPASRGLARAAATATATATATTTG